MQQIDLVRHGPVAGPAALYGWTRCRTAAVSASLSYWLNKQNYQQVLSSPLQRCRHSAAAQAQRLQLGLVIEPDFKEMNFGRWDGVPFFDEQSPDWPLQKLLAAAFCHHAARRWIFN